MSSWEVAFNGAEPVRAETIERFVETFSPCGFQRSAFYPCYGLAEATLIVSGGRKTSPPILQTVSTAALEKNLVVTDRQNKGSRILVGCGQTAIDQKIIIVNPEFLTECPPNQVGEIWVSGKSVAQGYWNRPEETEHTFCSYLEDTKEGPFLRTGDVGFLRDGELFITGRLKDLIIIRGRNHYPQDIELTVEQSHALLRVNCSAAFSVEVEGVERLVISAEVERNFQSADTEEVVNAIRCAVSKQHEMQVYGVLLLKTATLPKTSSGKIQRHACREAFLTKTLSLVGCSILDQNHKDVTKSQLTTEQLSLDSDLCEKIAQIMGIPASKIQPQQPINNLGLDSLQVLELKNYIEENYDIVLPIEKLFDEITLTELVREIFSLQASKEDAESSISDRQELPQITSEGVNQPFLTEVTATSASEKLNGHKESLPKIDLNSHLRLVYKSSKNVLQRAREFSLPDRLRATGLLPYFRELERNEGTTCVFEGRQAIMLGSNNYLGLTADRRVREATARAALEEGPSLTGSRLLNGSTTQHRELERKLAAFLGHEDVLVFTTGYQANLGLISALMNENTTLVLDSQAHACMYDGAFMSRCKVVQYQHNNLEDLERRLQEVTDKSATMVAIDGVYSMTGDIAPLPEIRALCDRYNATLAVDDAHGLGMLGATGKGTEEHFNIIGNCEILCGTFSKSLASIGGWVAAEAKVIDWIRFHGRSMLFSASIPPTSVCAASTALDILISEPWRVKKLNENAQYWRSGLKHLGFHLGDSQTPIIPVIIGDDLKCMVFGKELLEAGVYVNSVVYPAVPRTSALLRTSVMATHEKRHLDEALEIFAKVGKKLGLIN